MIQNSEYSRNINKSSLILTVETDYEPDWDSIEMFRYNRISYFLCMHAKKRNLEEQFYYDITGKRSLDQVLEYKTLDYTMLLNILKSFDQACIQTENYMLTENDILLDPAYVFSESESAILLFCYVPGNMEDICRQFQTFMEYLLQHLDHKDEQAVQLAYGVHQRVAGDKEALHSVMADIAKGKIGYDRKKSHYIQTSGKSGMTEEREAVNAGKPAKTADLSKTEKADKATVLNKNIYFDNTGKIKGAERDVSIRDAEYTVKSGQAERTVDIGNAGDTVASGQAERTAKIENAGDMIAYGQSEKAVRIENVGDTVAYRQSEKVVSIGSAGNIAGTGQSKRAVSIGSAGNIAGTGQSERAANIGSAGNIAGTGQSERSVNTEKQNRNEFSGKTERKFQRKKQQKEKRKTQTCEKIKRFLLNKLYTDNSRHEEEIVFEEDTEEEIAVSNPTVCLMPETDEIHNQFVYQGFDRSRDFSCRKGKMILGSSMEDSDICIQIPLISRIHARIEVNETGTFLEDMNSKNGTQVNGELLQYRKQCQLQKGDIISFAGEFYSFH